MKSILKLMTLITILLIVLVISTLFLSRRSHYIIKLLRDNWNHNIAPAPQHPQPNTWRNDQCTAAWIGHSTILINFYGVWILTDPIFSNYAGPNLGPLAIGPKRYTAPALKIEELPKIDIILISHAHFDHFDTRSLSALAKLNPQTLVISPRRTRDLFGQMGFEKITELDWQQQLETNSVSDPLTISAIQMKHWGARWQKDTYRGYNGYLLKRRNHSIFFCGDTALLLSLAPDVRKISGTAPDIAFMPIGAYDPWINNHCNPEQAALMAKQMGTKYLFPMHCNTFKLSNEAMDEPMKRLKKAIPANQLAIDQIGDTFILP